MAMQGTYGPEAYQMRMSMNARTDSAASSGSGSGLPGGMTMIMRIDAKRIGECAGKTA